MTVSSSDGHARFKERRRRWVCGIMRDKSLPISTRCVGYTIGLRLNRDHDAGCVGSFGATLAHPSTLARDLGIKFAQARDDVELLEHSGYLRRAKRGAHNYTCAIWRDDLPLPLMRGGSKEFARRRGEWIDAVMLDAGRPLAQRVIAYAIAMLVDPVTAACDASGRDIASLFGVSARSVDYAVRALAGDGLVRRHGREITLLRKDCANAAQTLRKGPNDHPTESNACRHNPVDSVNPVNIPSPTDSAPSAARRGHGEAIDWDRFAEVAAFLTGHHHKTVGGIISATGGVDSVGAYAGLDFSASEIQKFVRAGLLWRDGQHVGVTAHGWRCVEHFEKHDHKEAA